jgi:hypothetical protein
MTGASNTLLALILAALGIVGVILSFLVPDRKKSFISLIMAGVVVLIGLVQVVSQSVSDYRWRRRLTDLREQRQVDLDKLRDEFKKRAADNAPAAPKK